jgi:hypothetical protein
MAKIQSHTHDTRNDSYEHALRRLFKLEKSSAAFVASVNTNPVQLNNVSKRISPREEAVTTK